MAAGWLAGWLTDWLWLTGSGWLALARWLAGWLEGCWMGHRVCIGG